MHRILSRVAAVTTAIDASSELSEERFKQGCMWIEQQLDEASPLIAADAKLPLADRARTIFIGFRPTIEDRNQVSFDREVPPWEFSIIVDFQDKLPDEGIAAIKRRTRERAGDMHCPEHGNAPHYILTGYSHAFQIGIETCCEAFGTVAYQAALGIRSSG